MSETEVDVNRSADDNRLRIRREIPLWNVLAAAGGAAVFFITFGFMLLQELRESRTQIAAMSASIIQLTAKIENVSSELSGKNLKDLEHDLRLNDAVRRIGELEDKHRGDGPRKQP